MTVSSLWSLVLESKRQCGCLAAQRKSHISAHQLLTAPTVSLVSPSPLRSGGWCCGMRDDAGLFWNMVNVMERVSPRDGSELGVLSLRISWLVISCCIWRNVFFSSFHVLFKKLSYPVSAANSLNVICLSIAPLPRLLLFLGLFLPLCLQLCLIIWLQFVCVRACQYTWMCFSSSILARRQSNAHNPGAAVWWGLTSTLGVSEQHN